MNPQQNALLQLKIAMIRRGSLRGYLLPLRKGSHPDFKRIREEFEDALHPGGKILVALAKAFPEAQITGLDLSPVAAKSSDSVTKIS